MERGSLYPCGSSRTMMNPLVQAQLKKLESYPRQSLPRCLFRCYSIDHSQGINDLPLFYSAGRHNSSQLQRRKSLPPLPVIDLAAFSSDARQHLTYSQECGFRSPLISFTSSLLVALVCARKADFEDKLGVRIAMLDTKEIMSKNPIFPCSDLKDLVNSYSHDRVLIPGDSVDEYLAYGSVEAKTSYTLFRDLVVAEHFGLLPELYPYVYYRDKWPKLVLNLRDQIFTQLQAVTERERQIVQILCSKFDGEDCRLAITVQLFSLRRHSVETDSRLKEVITDSIQVAQLESFVGVDHEYKIGLGSSRVCKYASTGHGVTHSTAPELEQYAALVDTICEELNGKQDEKFRKKMKEGIVDTVCSACACALQRYRSSYYLYRTGSRNHDNSQQVTRVNHRAIYYSTGSFANGSSSSEV